MSKTRFYRQKICILVQDLNLDKYEDKEHNRT